MKRILIYCICLLPIVLSSQSSEGDREGEQRIGRIVSHEYMWDNYAEDRAFLANLENLKGSKEVLDYRSQRPAERITLPVIFHVLYQEGSRSITEDQLQTQLEALNRDFGSFSDGFDHKAYEQENFREDTADPEIEFVFAQEALTGSGKSVFANTFQPVGQSKWKRGNDMKSSKTGGVDVIYPEAAINVWVVDLEEGISGYAQMPGGVSSTDGIVIDYEYVGIGGSAKTGYDEGKTLTHLVGNYLNLYSLWGIQPCQDDGVSDTPIHSNANYGCPSYKRISTCRVSLGAAQMTMNFMDNTDDACKNMFTKGQTLRMYQSLSEGGGRHTLLAHSKKAQ